MGVCVWKWKEEWIWEHRWKRMEREPNRWEHEVGRKLSWRQTSFPGEWRKVLFLDLKWFPCLRIREERRTISYHLLLLLSTVKRGGKGRTRRHLKWEDIKTQRSDPRGWIPSPCHSLFLLLLCALCWNGMITQNLCPWSLSFFLSPDLFPLSQASWCLPLQLFFNP